MVTEMWSPPRVTSMASRLPELGLIPGLAMDLTCNDPDDGMPWDFNDEGKRTKAMKHIKEMEPLFVVVSPMCRAFSAWQALNKAKHPNSAAHMEETKQEAMLHLNFATEICREQVENGRYFLFEFGATSWHEECLQSLAEDSRVGKAHSDQCQMGAVAVSGPSKGGPVKKDASKTAWLHLTCQ